MQLYIWYHLKYREVKCSPNKSEEDSIRLESITNRWSFQLSTKEILRNEGLQ